MSNGFARRAFIALLLFQSASLVVFGQDQFKAKVADVLGTAQKCADNCSPISVGDFLGPMTIVKTGSRSAVLLQLVQDHMFRIGAGSTIQLKELGQSQSFSFGLIEGWIWSFVNKASKPAKYEVETPSGILGVTGTVFSAFHSTNTGITTISSDEGTVEVRHARGVITVAKGLQTHVHRDEPHPVQVEKQDADHRKMWSLMDSHESWMKPTGTKRLHPHMPRHLSSIHQKLQSRRP